MSNQPDYQPLPNRIMKAVREFAAHGVSETEIGVYVGDVQTATTAFLPEPGYRAISFGMLDQMVQARENGQPFGTLYGAIPLRFDPTLGPGMLEVRGGELHRATMTID